MVDEIEIQWKNGRMNMAKLLNYIYSNKIKWVMKIIETRLGRRDEYGR